MKVYRISSEKYAGHLGASGTPNRWNKENQYVLYTASSRSLATLEMVAHRNAIMGGLRYKMMIIQLPDAPAALKTLLPTSLPEYWNSLKGYSLTQRLGSNWYLDQESLVLGVPSALVPQENNYVINTRHPDFSKVKLISVLDYNWDKRLL